MALSQELTRFEHLFIDEASRGSRLVARLLDVFPAEKVSWVREQPFAESRGEMSPREFDRSKRNLYVTPFKGQFFKRCPGSRPGLACCNYFVLNWGLQCDMNCSYCYLQSFINTPTLTIYSNLEDALGELRELGTAMSSMKLRVGTGETVDSLSLDDLTLNSHQLIDFFRDYPAWQLEFKTKSAKVEQFLELPHAGNVIVSWSVNPQYVIDREEHGTASLDARFQAAEKCLEHGFQVAFHIDPMIWHSEWKENYSGLVDILTSRFKPTQVPYISAGGLRFQPEQRHLMRERFGMESLVNRGEMFVGKDGKLRYDQRLREEMFSFLLSRFQAADEKWKLFLCMETPETWISAAGSSPFKTSQLHDLFDSKVILQTRL